MILVTGALGFIGVHTVRALLDAGETVIATRHRSSAVPSFLEADVGQRLIIEPLDVTQPDQFTAVIEKHGVDSILHMTAPPLGALEPSAEFRLNTAGLINALEAAHAAKVRRLSIASSVAVYAGLPAGPFSEADRLRPFATSSTEAYKKTYETLGLYFAAQTGLDVICLRISNIYGPCYRSLSNVPSRMVHAAAQGKPGPLPRPGAPEPFAEDGSDFCYVKDCARGLQMLHMGEGLKHKVYNVSSGRATSLGEMARAVEAAKPGARIELSPGKGPAHVDNPAMDITRATEDVGYRPQYTPQTAAADYLAWLEAGNER